MNQGSVESFENPQDRPEVEGSGMGKGKQYKVLDLCSWSKPIKKKGGSKTKRGFKKLDSKVRKMKR